MPRLSCLFLANLALTFSLTPFLSGWEPAAIPRKPVLSVGINIAPSGNLNHSFCASIAVIACAMSTLLASLHLWHWLVVVVRRPLASRFGVGTSPLLQLWGI